MRQICSNAADLRHSIAADLPQWRILRNNFEDHPPLSSSLNLNVLKLSIVFNLIEMLAPKKVDKKANDKLVCGQCGSHESKKDWKRHFYRQHPDIEAFELKEGAQPVEPGFVKK